MWKSAAFVRFFLVFQMRRTNSLFHQTQEVIRDVECIYRGESERLLLGVDIGGVEHMILHKDYGRIANPRMREVL